MESQAQTGKGVCGGVNINVIVSCHIDTIFRDPFATTRDGYLNGTCDNLAGILACAQLIGREGIFIEWTNDEEGRMDGARYVAKDHSADDTFIIVADVTERKKNWDKIHFTAENWFGIQPKHIKKALQPLSGHYRMTERGLESEAWLYKDLGFATLEIDIPVSGGIHNLKNKARLIDIQKSAEAIDLIRMYLLDKTREQICDKYKPE